MAANFGLLLLIIVPIVAYHHVIQRSRAWGFVARMSSLPTPFCERFTSTALLYTGDATSAQNVLERLYSTNVCVIGLGGVGSWVVEALARSGIGRMTLVDSDDVCTTNINRQLVALSSTVGSFKAEVLKLRVLDINPTAKVICELDFARPFNVDQLIMRESSGLGTFDFVVDAVDDVQDKAAIIDACVRAGTPVITCGGAGGLTDPSLVRTTDLAFAAGDRLLSGVRRHLRRHYGYPKGDDQQPGTTEHKWDILSVHSAPTNRPRSSSSSSSSSRSGSCSSDGSSPIETSAEQSINLDHQVLPEAGQDEHADVGGRNSDSGADTPAAHSDRPRPSSLRSCDGSFGSAAFTSGTIGLQAAACVVNAVGWAATGRCTGDAVARRPKQLGRRRLSSSLPQEEARCAEAAESPSVLQSCCSESSPIKGQEQENASEAAPLAHERAMQEEAILTALGGGEQLQLWDAHCHLQLDPLYGHAENAVALARRCGVQGVAVCGTCPGEDWERVAALAQVNPDYVVPSFGLHPWWIARCLCEDGAEAGSDGGTGGGGGGSDRWAGQLEDLLIRYPSAHVGECGLDKAVLKDGVSYDQQEAILLAHLRLAGRYGRTLTMHCVSGCWDHLLQLLRREDRRSDCAIPPAIVLHSCNTLPREMVPHLLRLRSAVYFSLSAGGRGGLSAKTLALAAAVPPDGLLLETDSPDQLIHTLRQHRGGGGEGKGEGEGGGPTKERSVKYNEPAALALHCRQLAEALNCAAAEIADRTRINTMRAFGKT